MPRPGLAQSMNDVAASVGGRAGRDLHVLALNSGSSSLKFGLYRMQRGKAALLLTGEAEAIGERDAVFHAADAQGRALVRGGEPIGDQVAAVLRIRTLLADSGLPAPQAIGHRVVHGGPQLREHCRIDASVLEQISAATAFAPLHTPAALAVIRAAQAHFSGLPAVACFDTSFHGRMPDVAACLPLPAALRAEGIRRYGFHGLSCESIVHQLAGRLPSRLLIAHLGNGASVTAVLDGVSIDTSMGLTPTGGLVMGTRCGDLDPGALVYLMRAHGLDAAGLEDLVDRRSGLAGISGIGGDMRALHAAGDSNPDAQLAIRMFCYRAAKELAAMSTALGGVDAIVFTGGIGENDAQVRAEICGRLACIGVDDDSIVAELPGRRAPRCRVLVLPSREEVQIARHVQDLC